MYPYTLRVPYTLQLTTKIGPHQSAFVCEIDAELVVEYEDTQNWEISALRFEQTRWNPEFEVTPESDPDLWKLVERALDMDDKTIAARIVEAGEEERAACKADAADQAYEAYRDRMWEAGR